MSNKVHVLSHPLINARLSRLRQTNSTSKDFREVRHSVQNLAMRSLTISMKGIHDISLLLGFEASRDLEEETFTGVSLYRNNRNDRILRYHCVLILYCLANTSRSIRRLEHQS